MKYVNYQCRINTMFTISSPKFFRSDDKLSSKCIVRCGQLTKSPPSGKYNFLSTWKKRYFVLYDPSIEDNKFCEQKCCLYYFKQRKDEVPIDKIILEDTTVEEGKPINNFKWVINLQTRDRLYHLCAKDENDYSNWLEALRKVLAKNESEHGFAERSESVDEFVYPKAKKESSPEMNLRLREELDRMKLERQYNPDSSPPDEPIFDNINFNITPTNSNKDSGIETGEDYVNKKDLKECREKNEFYDSPPTALQRVYNESNQNEIYGNINDYDPLPRHPGQYGSDQPPPRPPKTFSNEETVTEDDIYDAPTKTHQQPIAMSSAESNALLERDIASNYTEDEIYDIPPKSPTPPQSRHSPLLQTAMDLAEDEIYDIPPKSPSPSQTRQQSSTNQKQNYEFEFTQDEIYDTPPKPPSPSQTRQQFSTNQEQNYDILPRSTIDHTQDEIYDTPPKPPSPSQTRQQFPTNQEQNYDILPRSTIDHTQDEIYDTPPQTSLQSSTIKANNTGLSYTEDEIYDTPPANSNFYYGQQTSADIHYLDNSTGLETNYTEDEIYGNLVDNQPIQYSGQRFCDTSQHGEIYDTPPQQSMNFQNHVLDQQSYFNIPNQQQQTTNDVYDVLPPSDTRSFSAECDEIYDSPPRKSSGNPEAYQQDEIYECPPISRPYDSLPQGTRTEVPPNYRTMPQGYDVINNNDDIYDVVPQMNKPLPYPPGEDDVDYKPKMTTSSSNDDGFDEGSIAEYEQKCRQRESTTSHLDQLQQNGKVFHRFSYR